MSEELQRKKNKRKENDEKKELEHGYIHEFDEAGHGICFARILMIFHVKRRRCLPRVSTVLVLEWILVPPSPSPLLSFTSCRFLVYEKSCGRCGICGLDAGFEISTGRGYLIIFVTIKATREN